MKITKEQLKQIIKEELEAVLEVGGKSGGKRTPYHGETTASPARSNSYTKELRKWMKANPDASEEDFKKYDDALRKAHNKPAYLKEEEGAKTLSPKDARAAIEDGTIKSLEKFYILSPYYDLKADKQYTKKEPAIYVGDGDQVPPETAGNVNVYYKRGGDIVSMRQSARKSLDKLDQKLRNDPDQPYTKQDLDRMR